MLDSTSRPASPSTLSKVVPGRRGGACWFSYASGFLSGWFASYSKAIRLRLAPISAGVEPLLKTVPVLTSTSSHLWRLTSRPFRSILAYCTRFKLCPWAAKCLIKSSVFMYAYVSPSGLSLSSTLLCARRGLGAADGGTNSFIQKAISHQLVMVA